MRRPAISTTITVLAAVSLVACSDSGSPSTDGAVNFNLATRSAAPAVASTMALADGTNTLVIDRIQLVLREIELRRSASASACGGSEYGDACEKLEVGPVLLDLPLGGDGGAARSFGVTVAQGTYDEVEFEIHAASDDDASDAAFVQEHPEFARVSVKVSGSYNGAAFVYTSDLNAEQEIGFDPPLTIAGSTPTELTLFVDIDRWFRDGAGTLVDPGSANAGAVNENLVRANIRSSLRAFEDEDHDGSDD